MTQRTYAIGDIHGHLNRLKEVHAWIAEDRSGETDVVVHVGDLTDRGPDSAGVIRYLIDGLTAGQPWMVLKGNHDRMMALYLQDPSIQDPKLRPEIDWMYVKCGGLQTLESYAGKVDNLDDAQLHRLAMASVPQEHIDFLLELDTIYRTDAAVFVHAGILPGVAIEDQHEDDLTWIREPFLSDTRDHGPLIIHGHSAIEAPTHYGNRVNIDSGAGFGGPLSVVVVEGREVWNLTAAGRAPLLPVTRLGI